MGQLGGFTLAVSQNKYLPVGGREVHAILTVTASGLQAAGPGPAESAEVIMVDCSGSMDNPPTKISAARRATCAAIDCLRDGVYFGVVEGTGAARLVYPGQPELAVASARTRAEAKVEVHRLLANGGTAIGTWLTLAGDLLDRHPSAIRHATLFTDGKNEHESPAQLGRVLEACAGRFSCDARGIGDAWEPKELRRIAAALRGEADAVRHFADLEADLQAILRTALGRVVPDVGLRFRTPPSARVRYVKQMYPTVADREEQRVALDETTIECWTGAWSDERREYHVCLDVDPGGKPTRQDLRAARVDVVTRDSAAAATGSPGTVAAGAAPAAILAHWTDDAALSTRIDASIAHYTGQRELGEAVRAGCDAHARQDLHAAERDLGQAVRLAHGSGNQEILTRLARLVDIIDAERGLVRLKTEIRLPDRFAAETGSGISAPLAPSADGAGPPELGADAPKQVCPQCTRICPPAANFCGGCGHRIGVS